MAFSYEVQEGDCIGSIAFSQGFDWNTLWNHPENAALKGKRRDPNILLAGDIVYVPDLSLRQQPCATDQRHTFQLKVAPANLQLRLLEEGKPDDGTAAPSNGDLSRYEDPDFQPATWQYQPRGNVPYFLYIDGVLAKSGNSDSDGFIKLPISPAARGGRLVLNPGTPREEVHTLRLGSMDPLDEIPGVKKRLANLGFPCDTDNRIAPEFEAALMLFQERAGLPITGKPDTATRNQLKQTHGG